MKTAIFQKTAIIIILLILNTTAFTAPMLKMSVDGYQLQAISEKRHINWTLNFNYHTFLPTKTNKAVFVGNENGEILKISVQAGQIIWRKKLSSGWVYSPSISHQLLITGGQSGIIYAIDQQTQKIVWQKDLQQELVYQTASNANLTIATTFDGKVHALLSQNGDLKWQQQFPTPSQYPLFHQKQVILASYAGNLRFLSLDNGDLKRQENIQTFLLSSPTLKNNQLQLTNNNEMQYIFNL